MSIFQYTFMQNALIAGLIIAILAPILGIFLIIRRYTSISDTLAHTSLTGVMIGLINNFSPILTTLGYSIIMAFIIEKLRLTKKLAGDMVLALILASNLSIVAIILSLNNKVLLNISSYLFGSIALVSRKDVFILLIVFILTIGILFFIKDSLIKTTYDEDSAEVSGINTKRINLIFIICTSVVITTAIPIVGVLLVGSLLILPIVIAIQISKSFKSTLIIAEIISIFGVFSGVIISYYIDISASGIITLIFLFLFIFSTIFKK